MVVISEGFMELGHNEILGFKKKKVNVRKMGIPSRNNIMTTDLEKGKYESCSESYAQTSLLTSTK